MPNIHTLAGILRCPEKIMGPRPMSLKESQRARRGLRAALLLQRLNNGQDFSFFLTIRTHSFKENYKRKWVLSRAGKKAQVALHGKGKEREGKKKDVNLVNFRFHVRITKLYEGETNRPSSQTRRTREEVDRHQPFTFCLRLMWWSDCNPTRFTAGLSI